jgi:hypothetical protein
MLCFVLVPNPTLPSPFIIHRSSFIIHTHKHAHAHAQVFNGVKHHVTVTANKLVDKLQKSLNHERDHLGADKDTIRIMENAIEKKAALLRKAARTSAAASSGMGMGGGGGGGGASSDLTGTAAAAAASGSSRSSSGGGGGGFGMGAF